LAAFVETLAPTRCNHDATDAGMRNPITGIAGCRAPAASGHATAALPRSVMNSRRLMWDIAAVISRRFEAENCLFGVSIAIR
jgi:hypothetical protein